MKRRSVLKLGLGAALFPGYGFAQEPKSAVPTYWLLFTRSGHYTGHFKNRNGRGKASIGWIDRERRLAHFFLSDERCYLGGGCGFYAIGLDFEPGALFSEMMGAMLRLDLMNGVKRPLDGIGVA